MSIEAVKPSNHLIHCLPLLLFSSLFPSIRVFSNDSTLCVMWSKCRSFNSSISLSSEYSRLISFRIDWFDIIAVQGPLKNLLQHHSSKASVLWHSAFFIVQLSHLYMTTGKSIALTRWTFVYKVMSLLWRYHTPAFWETAQETAVGGTLPLPWIICLAMNEIKQLRMTQYPNHRRQWHPTPVLLPGKSHGWRSLAGCNPWGS